MKKSLDVTCRILRIVGGTFFYSLGTVFLINPYNLAPGGFPGLAIIINRAIALINPEWNVPIGLIVFILNIPLLIIGLIKFGKNFLVGTVFGTVLLSLFIYLLEIARDQMLAAGQTWFIIDNTLLAAIFGGVCMAIGMGMVFKANATTGGTDIIAKLLRLKFRYVGIGRLILIVNTVICLSSLPFVGYKVETVLYAFVAMSVSSFMLDIVLYGRDGAKLVYIVSDNSEKIAQRLLNELPIGATILDGVGAYTHEKKEVLMCAVKKHTYPMLKDIIKQEDPKAFLIVASASEVFGEGYKDQFKEEV